MPSHSPGSGAVRPSVQTAAPADAKSGLAAHSRRVETAGIVLPPGSDVVSAADESGGKRAKTGPARQSSGFKGRQGCSSYECGRIDGLNAVGALAVACAFPASITGARSRLRRKMHHLVG